MHLEHSLCYFGAVKVQLPRHSENHDNYVRESERSNEEKVIDQLEMAQLNGTLTRDIKKSLKVVLRLSGHGVQIMTPDKELTQCRIALLNLLFTLAYDDGLGKYNCAIMETCPGDMGICNAHVFQADSRCHANQIIVDIDNLFKKVEEQCRNLPSPQIE